MKIIILGAGQVGGTLAEHLAIDLTLHDARIDRTADVVRDGHPIDRYDAGSGGIVYLFNVF